ncbi:hypothetical protein Droror1_Dr00009118 [Drosera rotundifolia]
MPICLWTGQSLLSSHNHNLFSHPVSTAAASAAGEENVFRPNAWKGDAKETRVLEIEAGVCLNHVWRETLKSKAENYDPSSWKK